MNKKRRKHADTIYEKTHNVVRSTIHVFYILFLKKKHNFNIDIYCFKTSEYNKNLTYLRKSIVNNSHNTSC